MDISFVRELIGRGLTDEQIEFLVDVNAGAETKKVETSEEPEKSDNSEKAEEKTEQSDFVDHALKSITDALAAMSERMEVMQKSIHKQNINANIGDTPEETPVSPLATLVRGKE